MAPGEAAHRLTVWSDKKFLSENTLKQSEVKKKHFHDYTRWRSLIDSLKYRVCGVKTKN